MEKKRITRNFFLSGISGLLIVLSQPPFPFFFVAYFCLIPLFLSLERKGSSLDFFLGLKTGMVAYTGIIYWVVIAMNRYGRIDPISSVASMLLLALYLALYIASFTYATSFLERKLSIPLFFSAPFVWTIMEYVRNYMLSGFPWALFAYSQHNFLPLIQICSFTGPYYVSFLIVCMNCTIFFFLKRQFLSRKSLFFISLFLLIFSLTITYGVIRLRKDFGRSSAKNVVIVQPSIRQDVKWTEEYKIETVRKHMLKTLHAKNDVDLFVWPETALPFVLEENKGVLNGISEFAKTLGAPILTGALSRDEQKKLYNAAYLFDRDGKVKGIYRKVHLVPFGEYTPLVRYFPFLGRITVSGEDFHPGTGHEPLSLPGFGKLGILICYEGIFPEISRETVRRGADLLVNLTNDAWYDRSSAPYQHFAFYIFRAVETERYVIRCANTGISGIIDPRGRILKKSGLFNEETLSGEVFPKSEKTFYVRYGDWFVFLLFFVFILVLARTLLSHKKFRK